MFCYTLCAAPSTLSVEAYERRIQRLERDKNDLARKLQGTVFLNTETVFYFLSLSVLCV